MSLLDLFLPSYNNSNKEKRLAYVSGVDNDKALLEVFNKTKYDDVKYKCIECLKYEDGLITLLKSNSNEQIVKSIFKRFGTDNFKRNLSFFTSSTVYMNLMIDSELSNDFVNELLKDTRVSLPNKIKLATKLSDVDLANTIEQSIYLFDQGGVENLILKMKDSLSIYKSVKMYIHRYRNDDLMSIILPQLSGAQITELLKQYEFNSQSKHLNELKTVIKKELSTDNLIDLLLNARCNFIKDLAIDFINDENSILKLFTKPNGIVFFNKLSNKIKDKKFAIVLFNLVRTKGGTSFYLPENEKNRIEEILMKVVSLSDSSDLYLDILKSGLYTDKLLETMVANCNNMDFLNMIVQKCQCDTKTYEMALAKINNEELCNFIFENEFPLKLKLATVKYITNTDLLINFINNCSDKNSYNSCKNNIERSKYKQDFLIYCDVVMSILSYNKQNAKIAETVLNKCGDFKLKELAYSNLGNSQMASAIKIEEAEKTGYNENEQFEYIKKINDQCILKDLCSKIKSPVLVEIVKKINDFDFLCSFLRKYHDIYWTDEKTLKPSLLNAAFLSFNEESHRKKLFECLLDDNRINIVDFAHYIKDNAAIEDLLGRRSEFLLNGIKEIRSKRVDPDKHQLVRLSTEVVQIAELYPRVFIKNWKIISDAVELKEFRYTSHTDYSCGKHGYHHHEDKNHDETFMVNISFPPFPAHKLHDKQ